ncbi:MAG: DUF2256 domain-containing protein [Flavobacteriales bacterium]|nr:DUF2256 domain-containing protein [Flavobacteriales bacterium]
MPRHVPPSERASRTCMTCGRPFQWRKKWERVWEEVKYCSERCRRKRPTV